MILRIEQNWQTYRIRVLGKGAAGGATLQLGTNIPPDHATSLLRLDLPTGGQANLVSTNQKL
jgi:hypothetical protein